MHWKGGGKYSENTTIYKMVGVHDPQAPMVAPPLVVKPFKSRGIVLCVIIGDLRYSEDLCVAKKAI